MTDINGTVVGLQGFAVSSNTPQDGYVLTWDQSLARWEPKPPVKATLQKVYFTDDDTWVCPAGVTEIIVMGCGGGAGGGAGQTGGRIGGGGGGAALQQTSHVSVIPGETYYINIGAGGLGGTTDNGLNGLSTYIEYDEEIIFSAIGANSGQRGSLSGLGGTNWATYDSTLAGSGTNEIAASGGVTGNSGANADYGNQNYLNIFSGGIGGGTYTIPTFNWAAGGGGGGAGPQGTGGTGGDGHPDINGENGENADPNTGAGGGGGGASVSGTGGYGGNGGSGYLYIIYAN